MDDSLWQAVVTAAPHLADYLRMGTLLMPGGGGSEITSEAVHTFLSLLSMYSDAAIAARGGRLASHKVALRGGVVVNHWAEGCLEGCRRLELLVEMLAERTVGRRKKFPLLLYLEIIKALCKMYMCRTGLEVHQRSKRMNLAKAEAFKSSWTREDPERFRWWMASSTFHIFRPVVYLLAVILYGRRSWRPWLISLAMDILADLLARRRRAAPKQIAAPVDTLREEPAGAAGANGEEADLETGSRPVKARESAGGAAPWRNEQGGGAEEGCEGGAGKSRTDPAGSGPAEDERRNEREAWEVVAATRAEAGVGAWADEELRKRRALLLFYLLRTPAFDTILEPAVGAVKRVTDRVPLFGSLAGVAIDMTMSLHRYHFYNSGS